MDTIKNKDGREFKLPPGYQAALNPAGKQSSQLLAFAFMDDNGTDLRQAETETGNIEIAFHSGTAWAYPNVSRGTWENLLKAPSQGSFFATAIKKPVGDKAYRLQALKENLALETQQA